MTFYRLRHVAATATLGGCLYKSFSGKWPNSGFKIKALADCSEPEECDYYEDVNDYTIEWAPLGIWDLSFYNFVPYSYQPWASNPKKQSELLAKKNAGFRKWAPFCDHPSRHPPKFRDVRTTLESGCDILVCRNVKNELPNWTIEFLNSDKMADHHSCRYCVSRRAEFQSVDLENECEDNPRFMDKFKEYCTCNIDPCVFHALPPMINRARIQSNRLWDDFYHYILYLTDEFDHVCVCSGPCFTERKMTKKEKKLYPGYKTGLMEDLTHFYKIITVYSEEDCCFHYECYLFPYDTTELKCPELEDYRITKSQLEKQIGIQLFSDCPALYVGENFTCDEFVPHRKCPICFPCQVESPVRCQTKPPIAPCQPVPSPHSIQAPLFQEPYAKEPFEPSDLEKTSVEKFVIKDSLAEFNTDDLDEFEDFPSFIPTELDMPYVEPVLPEEKSAASAIPACKVIPMTPLKKKFRFCNIF